MMVVFSGSQPFLFSQVKDTITEKEVSRIIHYLASDSLKGRGNGRPELLKAGEFIGDEFRKNNLQPLPGFPEYFIPFRPFGGSKKAVGDSLYWNGNYTPPGQFIYIHPVPGNYLEKNLRDFRVIKLDSAFSENILEQFSGDSSSLLIWTNRKQANGKSFFPEMIEMPPGGIKHNLLLVYAEKTPDSLLLRGNTSLYSMLEYNIAGILPGKSKPDEVIIFSAHYDHEGVYGSRPDSIMNGANDDASGTTALLALANYFSKRNDNERTIMFCAFAGEELGLLGSQDFVTTLTNLKKIIAGINIEMIGIPQFGHNKVFITGERYSNLPDILRRSLRKNGIYVRDDPDEKKQLFSRSDNYSFVVNGVPFHTIMASDDDDPCYHQPCDEVRRIDIPNMTHIIKAIAASAGTLINGKQTPWRIAPSLLPKNN
ncbi:MAG: M28 family peptidase [Bacteroidota bacterium]|nr:M28 family peptidase [Bacteroidota bacterium]